MRPAEIRADLDVESPPIGTSVVEGLEDEQYHERVVAEHRGGSVVKDLGRRRSPARRRRWWKGSTLLFALLAGPAWGQGDVTTLEDRILAVVRSAEEPSGITVIRLKHAKAEELAATLSRVVPAGVTVVPDAPTNSLIILAPAPPPAQPIAID